MESILETQRRAHEELERLEAAMVSELVEPAKSHRERIAKDTRVGRMLERSQRRSQQVLELYEDKDGTRAEEVQAISGPNEFSEFYKRLKLVKDFHRRFPNEIAEPMELEFVQMEKDRGNTVTELETHFTGEEMFGKYLDLNAMHAAYVNLKGVKRMSYITYLDHFDHFKSISREVKAAPEYKTYLDQLLAYILSFLRRTQPLLDMDSAMNDITAEFDAKWANNEIIGWDHGKDGGGNAGLFCVACAKLFAKQTVFDAHLTGKKHQKAAAALLERTGGQIDPAAVDAERRAVEAAATAKDRAIALSEYLVHTIALNMLKELREETKSFVELKQSRTGEEQEEDKEMVAEETIEPEQDDDNDAEKPIYNPLNLPLGWDGKPIPFWLYKLHGLSVSYYCEICDTTFRGRKAFERHFTEWQHSNMLKRLGIPNTSQFLEITTVADALALWDKIQRDKSAIAFRPDAEEEFEDARGNVFNKKTWEDLKRQGLL